MERQSRQVDRRELERARDFLVSRQAQLRVMREGVREMLGMHLTACVSTPEIFKARAVEARWVAQAVDNRIVTLGEDALRKETLMQMLDDQAEQERNAVQVNKLDVLFIGGLRV